MNHRISTIIALGIILINNSIGQDVRKTVLVEGAYHPEILSAEKYGYMPTLSDTVKIVPVINYSVIPSHLQTNYTIKPIKPAKLVGSSLDELYKSHLKLGLGNYNTPLAEYSIHNLRSKEYALGAYVFHRSSHSKFELADGNKVPAGYGKNRVDLYGKRFYDKVNAEAELYLKTDKYRYYGYNTELAPDTNLEQKDIRQFYTHIGGRAEVYSTDPDSAAFSYKVGIDASYFGDYYKNRENRLHIPVLTGFNISAFRLDISGDYNLFSSKSDTAGPYSKSIVQIHPVLKKSKDIWEAKLGFNFYYTNTEDVVGNTGKIYFYPEAQLKFVIVEKVMEAYVGVNGHLEVNNLSKIAGENPYIMPGLSVQDTKHKLVGYGGLQGAMSKNSGYKINVSFNSIDDVYFFINDTVSILQNQFIVAPPDNMELVKFQGELWYSPFTFLDFYWKGAYNSFTLTHEEYPWHIPAFNMSFTTSYNFKEKIFASFDVINYGKRFAYNPQDVANAIELDPIWDLNLRLEYKYSNVLSGFLDFYNLLGQQYYLWNQYPNQKFNFMLGFTYKF